MLARAGQAIYLGERSLPRFNLRRLGLVVLALLLAGIVLWLSLRLLDPTSLPIKKIRAQGVFNHVTEAMLQEAVADIHNQGFFNVNVQVIQERVEQLPWVAHASVRRVWPDTLSIQVVEQKALARWADGGLVNTRGELFNAEAATFPKGLPLFKGPQDAEAALTREYAEINAVLEPLGLSLDYLERDARRALQLRLNNGIELLLGKAHRDARVQRFISVYQKLPVERLHEIARIDLRYTNGMSMQWKQQDKPADGRTNKGEGK